MKEYEFIYRKSFVQELLGFNISEVDAIKVLMKEQMKNASWHWGQSRMNPATIAGVLRMMIKRLQQEAGR